MEDLATGRHGGRKTSVVDIEGSPALDGGTGSVDNRNWREEGKVSRSHEGLRGLKNVGAVGTRRTRFSDSRWTKGQGIICSIFEGASEVNWFQAEIEKRRPRPDESRMTKRESSMKRTITESLHRVPE